MYQYVSALAKPLTGDKRWTSVNISGMTMRAIYATYSRVIATLSNVSLTANVSLDLANIRAAVGAETITFSQFLTNNGNSTLPTSNTLPVLNTKYARYGDAFRSGYTVTPVHAGSAPSAPMPAGAKESLLLTRTGVNYQTLYQSCLVSVNGFYHMTDYSTDGLYVLNGMQSQRLSGQNGIGLLNFQDIGTISYIPITSQMVYKQDPTQSLQDNCYLDAGQDLSNKTVYLVLGGYLHLIDNKLVKRISASLFCVNFGNLPYIDRYFNSKKYIDMSPLCLETTPRNPDQISIANFYSDDVITKYCSLSQSFFVVLSNNDTFVETEALGDSLMPGLYVGYTPPIYPITTQQGKHPNYWSTYEDTQWSIAMNDCLRKNYQYHSRTFDGLVSVDNAEEPWTIPENSPAWYLKIGSDNINM